MMMYYMRHAKTSGGVKKHPYMTCVIYYILYPNFQSTSLLNRARLSVYIYSTLLTAYT